MEPVNKLKVTRNMLQNLGEKDYSHINRLDMSDIGLTHLDPNILQHFPNIVSLDVEYNKIKKIENLENLKHLKELNMNRNDIVIIENIPQNIESLYLDHNHIEQFDNLSKYTNLKQLSLNGTNFKNLKLLLNMVNLEVLRLDNTLVQNLNWQLDKMPKLRQLKINKLKFLHTKSPKIAHLILDDPEWIAITITSDTIKAYGPQINFEILKSSQGEALIFNQRQKGLEQQYIDITKQKGQFYKYTIHDKEFDPNKILDKINQINQLELVNNNLTSIKDTLQFKQLMVLTIKNNKIEDIEGISKLQKLLVLILENNNISSLSDIRNTKIQILNVKGNPIQMIGQELDQLDNFKLEIDSFRLVTVFSTNKSVLEQILLKPEKVEIWITTSAYVRLFDHKFKILEHGLDLPEDDKKHNMIRITNQETQQIDDELKEKILGKCVICYTKLNDMVIQCGHLVHRDCQDMYRLTHPEYNNKLYCPFSCHKSKIFQKMYQ